MTLRILISIVLASLLYSCTSHEREKTENTKKESVQPATDIVQLSPEQVKNAGIETGLPDKKEMHTTIKVNGVIDVPPQNIVSISIPLGGYLKNMSLLPGMKVSRGTVLATLEDQQYIQLQQDYLTAKSRLRFTEADYTRQKELNGTKAVSDKVFQQALNDFESQKILLRSLSEKLRLIGIDHDALDENNISRSIHIHAPITGFITKVNVNVGKYISPTDILCELISPDDLHLSLAVFENDASDLVKGQKVICYANNHPELKYSATIHLITPNIGEERTTEVHCHLEKYSKDLLPGMFMNAEIQLNNAKVNVVPEDAVVKWNNKFYIFSEEGKNRYKMMPVETGNSNNGFIEIRSSLPSAHIVIKNAYTLLMKLKNSSEEG